MSGVCSSRIIRTKELAKRLGISRVTVWRWSREGRLPEKRRIGPNVVGWLASDIDDWFKLIGPEGSAEGTGPAEKEVA